MAVTIKDEHNGRTGNGELRSPNNTIERSHNDR